MEQVDGLKASLKKQNSNSWSGNRAGPNLQTEQPLHFPFMLSHKPDLFVFFFDMHTCFARPHYLLHHSPSSLVPSHTLSLPPYVFFSVLPFQSECSSVGVGRLWSGFIHEARQWGEDWMTSRGSSLHQSLSYSSSSSSLLPATRGDLEDRPPAYFDQDSIKVKKTMTTWSYNSWFLVRR